MTTPTFTRARQVLMAAGATMCALTLAACGSSAPTKPSPSASPSATGTGLTPPGTALAFGHAATVVSTAKPGVSNPLSITVTGVAMGAASDLARFGVPSMQPPVTPYYVKVDVKNVGTTDLGGTAIPLYLQDSKNVLVNYSPLSGTFGTCPSQTLPQPFGAGASVSACLIYLLPQGDAATLVSYRPVQTVDPITWTGPIAGQSPATH